MIKFVRPKDNPEHWYFFCGPFEAERSYFHHGEGYSFILMFYKIHKRLSGGLGFQYCYKGYFMDSKPYIFCIYLFWLKVYFLKRVSRSGGAKWHLSFHIQ